MPTLSAPKHPTPLQDRAWLWHRGRTDDPVFTDPCFANVWESVAWTTYLNDMGKVPPRAEHVKSRLHEVCSAVSEAMAAGFETSAALQRQHTNKVLQKVEDECGKVLDSAITRGELKSLLASFIAGGLDAIQSSSPPPDSPAACKFSAATSVPPSTPLKSPLNSTKDRPVLRTKFASPSDLYGYWCLHRLDDPLSMSKFHMEPMPSEEGKKRKWLKEKKVSPTILIALVWGSFLYLTPPLSPLPAVD